MLPHEHHRRAADRAGELAERDDGAREGDRADKGTDEQLDLVPQGDRHVQSHGGRIVDRRDGDKDRREADQRVHRRYQLRHLRHLHPTCDDRSDRTTDHHRSQNRQHVLAVRVDERERNQQRDRHADHAVDVAATGGLRSGQPPQREDETDRRDEVPECDLVGAHLCSLSRIMAFPWRRASAPSS